MKKFEKMSLLNFLEFFYWRLGERPTASAIARAGSSSALPSAVTSRHFASAADLLTFHNIPLNLMRW